MTFKGCQLRFHPKESHYPVPSACKRYTGTTTHLGKEYQYESYRWYYTMNNGIGCCFLCPDSQAMGNHPDDTEGVVILKNSDGKPEHVYFNAHGQGQGMWCTWDECEKTMDGTLIVYVARYSHASYPKAGLYLRGFGFANDLTSSTGRYIMYNSESFATAPTEMITKPLPSGSITPWLRFTLPLFMTKIRQL